jgi:tRNA(Arg) A34 adenosine deaminase TadA
VPDDPASAWEGLEEPWRVCLSRAWEAYGAGTIPVGAALVDGDGAVVAEGRNRVYERVAPPGQLANSLLAHAEVNALVALDPERRDEDHVLYTALEPCLLCVGATVMATVGRIRPRADAAHRGRCGGAARGSCSRAGGRGGCARGRASGPLAGSRDNLVRRRNLRAAAVLRG